jgi:hypothetical protein
MNKPGRLLLFGPGSGAAVALAGPFHSGTTRAVDLEHVKVVNPASYTVPVTGTVKAARSGSWKVSIDRTPTVNVASKAPAVDVNFPGSMGINGTVPVQGARVRCKSSYSCCELQSRTKGESR